MPASSISPELRGRPLPAIVFFFSTWVLLTAAGASQMFRDPGTFWHLLAGERILDQGLPHEDWLTFTFAGKPWIAHQWLAECAMALLRRLGGYDAMLLAATGGIALLFAWMFQRLVDATVHARWGVLLTSLAILTGSGSYHVRPLLLSMAFFAWTFARIADVDARRARILDLFWLLPLLLLWVNCHGAVLGGIATLWLAASLWLGAWALKRPSPIENRGQAIALGALVVGATLMPLANPYGLDLIRTWIHIISSPVIAEMIVEHGSVWRTRSWYVLPFAAVYVLMYLGAPRLRWRATSVLPLVWLVLTFQRVRHAPMFAVVAQLALPELLPHNLVVSWLARRRVDVCGGRTARRSPAYLWTVVSAAVIFAALTFQLGRDDLSGPRRGPWPFDFAAQLESSAAEIGGGAPVLNDMLLGGFLAHEFPGLRIFGDDRCELYGDEFLRAWSRGERDWYAEWVSRFDVRIAVAEHGTTLDAYLRATPSWREIATAPSAALYVRDGADLGSARR